MNGTTQPDKVFGYIYRITNPTIFTKNALGEFITPCYIGRTEKTVKTRFQGHLRDAKNVQGKDQGGDGKLHAIMWAHGLKGFVVEELDRAFSPAQLSEQEKHYQDKYDSIKYGWNKITASTITRVVEKSVVVELEGQKLEFTSIANLCRSLEVSNSTLTYWVKKHGRSLEGAIRSALAAKSSTSEKEQSVIHVFRRPYATINEAVRDPKLNRHSLNEKTIRGRIKKGMSLEDAFTVPPARKRNQELSVTAPDGKIYVFKNLTSAHKTLSEIFKVPPYSTVSSFYFQKGQSLEQSFGFVERPWYNERFVETDKLVANQGYKYIGEQNGQSNPLICHPTKEIFCSIKEFSKTFGLDYTTVASEIKRGLTAEEVLSKRNHPALKSSKN